MKINEKVRKYWEIWQNYEEKDLVYRIALVISVFVIMTLLVALLVASLRKPLVIAVKNDIPSVISYEEDSNQIRKEEARVFVQNFVKYYYNWTPDTVEKNLNLSLPFLNKGLRREVGAKIKEKVYDARAKKLSQIVTIRNLIFDDSKGEINLVSVRVFTVDTVRLASDFRVILNLVKRTRTKDSPFGLFISKITEPFDQDK